MAQTRRDNSVKQMLGRRLGELVESHLFMSWESLAKRLGYASSSTLLLARNGETLISVEKLAELAQVTVDNGRSRVSVDWLLTGAGPPLLDISQEPFAGEIAVKNLSVSIADRVASAPIALQQKIAIFLEIHGHDDAEAARDVSSVSLAGRRGRRVRSDVQMRETLRGKTQPTPETPE